jgi:hypothetical protein
MIHVIRKKFIDGAKMKELYNNRVLSVIISLSLVLLMCHATSLALKITDTEKLYAEIAGDYEFEYEGESAIITFFVKDGVLMGKDSEYDPGTPLEPVEGKELEFTATSEDGQTFDIMFSRDQNGKITKCLLVTMGMEIKGTRIKK